MGAGVGGAGASAGSSSAGGSGGSGGVPFNFQPTPPEVYVAKVKNLLTGLPPTDAEISMVKANASAFPGLVQSWMGLPQYQTKMVAFFATAFQQSQTTASDFSNQLPGVSGEIGINPNLAGPLLQNLNESFAMTAWNLAVVQGQPFNTLLTTQQFWMTPALMMFYAFLDQRPVDDKGKYTDALYAANPNFTVTVTSKTMISPMDSLTPGNSNYMHFYLPSLTDSHYVTSPACQIDPRVYSGKNVSDALYQVLMGGLENGLPNYPNCPPSNTASTLGMLEATDFTDWKPVTIRHPNSGEATTSFYDLASLRASQELVLNIPYYGFFTTPSYLAEWNTNLSNSARVTANQTLIVALGKAFDATYAPEPTPPASLAAIDPTHAIPHSACYTCHESLDPLRQFFRQSYSINFHEQVDPMETALPGILDFDGVNTPPATQGIADLATALAGHPLLPAAWVQKLCYYADSLACDESDPEFQRLVSDFQQGGLIWNKLIQDFMTSPITTGATETKTLDENEGGVVPISRRDHWCTALSNRLGLPDACMISTKPTNGDQYEEQSVSLALPTDGFGRGSVAPVLANDPDMFFRGGVENLCRALADQVVDAPSQSKYTSMNPTAAIADFASNIMGLTSQDPRQAMAIGILTSHFMTAQQAPLKQSATNALKSTFVLACTSPNSVALGL